MDQDIALLLSASKIRLRNRSPYLAILSGYLKPVQTESIPTAATDSVSLLINPNFWISLTNEFRDAILMHETIHAAMGHCWRIGPRELLRWNIAADYVTNLIVRAAGFTLPKEALLDKQFDEMTVEEVYELIKVVYLPVAAQDIVPYKESGLESEDECTCGSNEAYWKQALADAEIAAKKYGNDPLLDVLKPQIERSMIDWRKYLWKTLAVSSEDFTKFDRRLMGQGIYLEDLEPDLQHTLRCAVIVDTSGSTIPILGKFMGHLKRIEALYPELDVRGYWADVKPIGPFTLKQMTQPQGGGGTSFVESIKQVEQDGQYDKILYLTDLEGKFPKKPPAADVIWAVPAGTRHTAPFGKVLKIL